MQYPNRGLDRSAFLDVTECLVAALEARDVYTEGHSLRVADMSVEIASALGIHGVELEDIHIAAHLHDIGKIGIPDRILYKPGRFLPEEYEEIKKASNHRLHHFGQVTEPDAHCQDCTVSS